VGSSKRSNVSSPTGGAGNDRPHGVDKHLGKDSGDALPDRPGAPAKEPQFPVLDRKSNAEYIQMVENQPGDPSERESRVARFSTQWAVSLIGAIISLGGTAASLLAGVDGPLSVSFGLGGIVISLVLEALSKLSSLSHQNSSVAARNEQRLSLIDKRVTQTAVLLDVWRRGGDIGEFEAEVGRLVSLAQQATAASLNPIIIGQAVRMIRRSLDDLSPLANGRLQVDFSYSSLLLEMMNNAQHIVLGTSPVDIEEAWWNLPLYQRYLEIQEEIIKERGVEVTRIFIASNLSPELLKLMGGEAERGISVRFASTHRVQRELQEAYVIFDGQILHRTIPRANQDDDNLFSENLADVEEYTNKFSRLQAFSQSLESLKG